MAAVQAFLDEAERVAVLADRSATVLALLGLLGRTGGPWRGTDAS